MDSDQALPIDPDLVAGDPAAPALHRHRGDHQHRAAPAILAAVAVGGMLGAAVRLGVSTAMPTAAGGLPWATFMTNMAGCFGLGLLLALVARRPAVHPLLRPLLATGALGALTTMSTFQVETLLLAREGRLAAAAVYAVGSFLAGHLLAAAGLRLGRGRRQSKTSVRGAS